MDELILTKRRNRAYWFLIVASFFLYLVLTSSKNLYSAESLTLANAFGSGAGDKEIRGKLADTMQYYFYTYAVMQVALIFFMKKMNIKWFLTLTLGVSAILTILVGFTDTIGQHYVIYIANGFLQAGIWGCLLKILGVYLPARLLPRATQVMSAGPASAGAASFGVAAAFGDNWRYPFIYLGALVLISVILYYFAVTYMSKFPRENEMRHVVHADGTEEDVCLEDENDFIHLVSKKRVIGFYAVSMLMGFLLTSLYFMINNNLTYYLSDIGGFTDTQSKLLTVFAPICAVVGPFLTVASCEKHRNFILVCAAYFGVALVFATLLLFLFDANVVISLILLVLFLVSVNGGRSVTLSIASLRMRRKIDTGVYSTAVNAISSVASGISPKIIAMVLDANNADRAHGWQISFLIIFAWTLTSVLLLLGSALLVKFINRKKTT